MPLTFFVVRVGRWLPTNHLLAERLIQFIRQSSEFFSILLAQQFFGNNTPRPWRVNGRLHLRAALLLRFQSAGAIAARRERCVDECKAEAPQTGLVASLDRSRSEAARTGLGCAPPWERERYQDLLNRLNTGNDVGNNLGTVIQLIGYKAYGGE